MRDDGRVLVFGALGLLAAAGAYVSRSGRHSFRQASHLPTPVRWWRRGSFAEELVLSPFQKRLLYVAREYKDNPEVAIRAQDIIFSAIRAERNQPYGSMGVSIETLIDDVKAIRGPNADLSTYLELQNQCIIANDHPVWKIDFKRQTKYERLVPWVAKLMARVLRDARRNRLEAQDPHALRNYERDSERYEVELPENTQKILQWQDYYSQHIDPVADWYEYETSEARRRNRPIQDIMPMSWDEAIAAEETWHGEISRLMAQRNKVPADPAFDLSQGWTLQKLTAWEHFQGESAVLGHCIGIGPGYFREHQQGESAFYSIRDPQGVARFTMRVTLPSRSDPTTHIGQVKGTKDCLAGTRFTGRMEDIGYCNHYRPATPEELAEDLRVISESLSLLQPHQPVSRMLQACGDLHNLVGPWEKLERRRRMVKEVVRTLPQAQRAVAQQRFLAMPQRQLEAVYKPIHEQEKRRRKSMKPVEAVREAIRSVADALYPQQQGLGDHAARMVQFDSHGARTVRQQTGPDVLAVVFDDTPDEMPPAFWAQVATELEAHRPDLGWEEYRSNVYVVR